MVGRPPQTTRAQNRLSAPFLFAVIAGAQSVILSQGVHWLRFLNLLDIRGMPIFRHVHSDLVTGCDPIPSRALIRPGVPLLATGILENVMVAIDLAKGASDAVQSAAYENSTDHHESRESEYCYREHPAPSKKRIVSTEWKDVIEQNA